MFWLLRNLFDIKHDQVPESSSVPLFSSMVAHCLLPHPPSNHGDVRATIIVDFLSLSLLPFSYFVSKINGTMFVVGKHARTQGGGGKRMRGDPSSIHWRDIFVNFNFLNSFHHQTTVLDWDLEDDCSPTNQVPKKNYQTTAKVFRLKILSHLNIFEFL